MPPLSPLRSHNYYSPLSPLTPTAEVDIARYRGKPTPITLVTPRASSVTAENIRGEPHPDMAKHPLWYFPSCHSGENMGGFVRYRGDATHLPKFKMVNPWHISQSVR